MLESEKHQISKTLAHVYLHRPECLEDVAEDVDTEVRLMIKELNLHFSEDVIVKTVKDLENGVYGYDWLPGRLREFFGVKEVKL